ncbi:MAG: hypothetical protein PVJ61_06115 [Dehalococcoidia bacterium]|jgi:hypothetical protein
MGETEEFIQRFRETDKSGIPDFSKCSRPLDMALWVLWVAKDKVGSGKLTVEKIASVIVETQDISASAKSIAGSLNRAGDKVHRYYENGETYFKIMKPGKDYLLSLEKRELVNAFYFEPDSRFPAKRLLANQIFNGLEGDLEIVDPYCGERTLDVLESIKGRHVKFLTRLDNIQGRARQKFVRDLKDFKADNPNIEFRDYPNTDIHDRYIISQSSLVILGHSIKDLGSKESFAVVLDRTASRNIVQALSENFDRRWRQSPPIQ